MKNIRSADILPFCSKPLFTKASDSYIIEDIKSARKKISLKRKVLKGYKTWKVLK